MKILRHILAALVLAVTVAAGAAGHPKREFRGAWLHTVYQDGYMKRGTAGNKAYLRSLLDSLQTAGVNAVFFQVRPQADAFYKSDIEPWSRYLTTNGQAPRPYWDPLQFMIDECHARGMELHAWLNPYRVTAGAKQVPAAGHVYHKHPERFVTYGGKIYFDPGLPENREYIVKIVDDIVNRYDVDGIHFDDYFYPYPVKGQEFPDARSFKRYGGKMERDDWRRANVDSLIAGVHRHIRASRRPWVRFGVSPFGIWRNASSDPRGSATSGLQNYDGLYADVLLWARNGWVDYLMPQLYWELDHQAAGYRVLVDWWADNAEGRHVYVGQDVERCVKAGELDEKLSLQRQREELGGMCWWPGYALPGRNEFCQPAAALPPSYPWIGSRGPQTPQRVRLADGRLQWDSPEPSGRSEDAVRFVVYYSAKSEPDVNDAENIAIVTPDHYYNASRPGYYRVTALDRVNNESAPSDAVRVKTTR
ncbi:MAG: family 10 glycosylhydrolase [Muribaculaceae bacterium]|nr:family 10 glycosylhydrolase [Muribaculaceae bacterium]